VGGARPVAALTGNTGDHLAKIGPCLDASCVTLKATGDGCRVLDDPERAFRCRRGLGRVADRAGGLPRLGVPGDAVLEKSIAQTADRGDRLRTRSEDPFEQSPDPGRSLRNGDLHAAGRTRVGVFDSRAFAKRPRGQIRGKRRIGCAAKSRRVARSRLGAEFGGMAIPASLWTGESWSGGEQKQQHASYTIAFDVVAGAVGVRGLVRGGQDAGCGAVSGGAG